MSVCVWMGKYTEVVCVSGWHRWCVCGSGICLCRGNVAVDNGKSGYLRASLRFGAIGVT